jgi:hypothetical protein
MLHEVPGHLKGATLGAAHSWVRSKTSAREYTLHDSKGQKVSLADLTSGAVTEVEIGGEVRSNPVHPAELQPATYGRTRRVNLGYLLPEDISPALVTGLVSDEGLFGAVQSLSILLNRPVTEGLPVTPGALELLNARTYSEHGPTTAISYDIRGMSRGARMNPAPAGFGRSYGGRILGAESGIRDAAINDYVNETLTAINTGGALPFVVDMGQVNRFITDVFAPFLVAAQANREAIRYINTFLMPAAREMGIRGKALEREYKFLVENLATSPKDFYFGKPFALIAHPAFLFPQYAPMALPVPTSKKDKVAYNRLHDVLLLGGNAPRYDAAGNLSPPAGGKTKGDAIPVETLTDDLGGIVSGVPLNWTNVARMMRRLDLRGIIDSVARITQQPARVLDDQHAFVEAFQRISTKTRAQFITDVANRPSFFLVDLVGMVPRPQGWPDKFIMALMTAFEKVRDEDFQAMNIAPVDFLQPAIRYQQAVQVNGTYAYDVTTGVFREIVAGAPPPNAEEFVFDIDFDYDPETATVDFVSAITSYAAPPNQFTISQQPRYVGLFAPYPGYNAAGGPRVLTPEEQRVVSLLINETALNAGPLIQTASVSRGGLTVMDVVVDAIHVSRESYGYEPEEIDIQLGTLIVVLAMQNLSLTRVGFVGGVGQRLVESLNQTAQNNMNLAIAEVRAISAAPAPMNAAAQAAALARLERYLRGA